jgi:hypothetical protein
MRKSSIAILAATVLLAANASSAQYAGAPDPTSRPAAMPGDDLWTQIARMEQQMKTMQLQHGRTMSAKSPEERQKWMNEEHRSMQQSMEIMALMLRDPAMRGGALPGRGAGTADVDASTEAMHKGIEMLQLMTQIMRDQLGLIRGPGGTVTAPKR